MEEKSLSASMGGAGVSLRLQYVPARCIPPKCADREASARQAGLRFSSGLAWRGQRGRWTWGDYKRCRAIEFWMIWNCRDKRNQQNGWSVLSAGTWTTDGLPPIKDAIRKAIQIGLDILGHRSRVITQDMLQEADLVLVMESGQKEALQIEFPSCRQKIWLLSEAAKGISYDIPDPMNNSSNMDIVSEICELLHAGFDRICAFAQL
jgi:protein-tyrosine-phosphatase